MPVLPSAPAPELEIPASLATEPIGGIPAAALIPGGPVGLGDIAGFVLVRVVRDDSGTWFAAEATYDRPTSYAHAISDCQRARLFAGGHYRRLLTVSTDGTYS